MPKRFTIMHNPNVPPLKMDRSVKFAQQVLNRMVVFPSSPLMLFPLESFSVAVTVMLVTPTATQLPCRHHSLLLATVGIYLNELIMTSKYFAFLLATLCALNTFLFSIAPAPELPGTILFTMSIVSNLIEL